MAENADNPQTPTRSTEKSAAAYESARKVLAGGVNSPVRAFGAVGGTPLFIARAKGAVLVDMDGNEYIDYVGSWGPMILGHADERVAAAASKALDKGWSYGAPTEIETRLAECILGDFESMEKIRFVNSGTEATMSAIRLARGFTGRDYIVKFEGCYHGHADSLLVKGGSGLATFATPSSAGVPEAVTSCTIVAPYNDVDAIRQIFAQHGKKIAGVLIEPVAGNMGCVPPIEGFLAELRKLCTDHGSLLIFDEVMTGYRVGLGGAQQLYGVTPDITCLGKVIGGGLPVGAYGARAEIMDKLSPLGPVYQAGTLSGNPLAMATGLATLQAVHEKGFYSQLEMRAARLAEGLEAAARHAGVPITQNRVGSMATVFFQPGPVTDWSSAARSDTKLYAKFFHAMLERGVYLAPSQYEVMFMSVAHTFEQIDATIAAAEDALRSLKS
ncbi:MAG TPA: glutamate-1-semialdehyde 2,1-aminomutase [Phycisphaerae bacterium]|nr:glutamate-1-semialdehyde 2,1-aminomutase [Phycisphaerae bacterium]HOJ72654.1 glutamate-1-semialdehyde 2,1-aminomutase [Phycisphaerae bacterium]HOM49685.1 glutamate-1-semialdehyde 2,1-aminomutase [Phycisphaerae bacterium]HON65178.1 glutamate-1-semialdehyde 2,1-aminomutase [Phycisphaerae bacterium]HOQ85121.1 glutamate-1-semialdehyde 2,1-aminomutase [Phycisphaerae bacterium]